MTPDFWQKKWQSKQIGFNQQQPNPLLVKHIAALNLNENSRVFVPLCGKSIDMVWLASQKLEVVGVELVGQAVIEFFDENNIAASAHPHPNNSSLKYYQGQFDGCPITLWVGDIFELSAADVGKIDAIYDRAALVALPDNDDGENALRVQYSKQLITLTNNAQQLLLTFGLDEVDESTYKDYPGPPFLISQADLGRYYDHAYKRHLLERYETKQTNPDNKRWLNLAWHLIPKGQ